MDEIKLGDLVTYISGQGEDARKLWMVIRLNRGIGVYTLMEYTSPDDIRCIHNKPLKIQDAWNVAVRKELFQTQLMQAELHDWFLKRKEVGGAE